MDAPRATTETFEFRQEGRPPVQLERSLIITGDRSTPVACRPAPSTFGLTPRIACHLVGALLHVVGRLRERPAPPEELAAEEPDVQSEAVSDDWSEGPDPKAGTLVDEGGLAARETPRGDAGVGEIHVTEDERDRAGAVRESGEEGPPPDPDDTAALERDRGQEPEPDDWR